MKNHMRICFFSRIMTQHRVYYVPPPVLLIRSFAGMGKDLTALTTSQPDNGSGTYTEDSAEVHYLNETRSGYADDRFWRASAKKFDFLHAEKPFDLIIGRGNATWGYFKYSRFSWQIPVISHEGTYPLWLHQIERRAPSFAPFFSKPLALLWALFRQEYRDCLMRSDRVVCNSPALAETLKKISRKKSPHTQFIPYGFMLAPYKAASANTHLKAPPRLIFVGRLTWDKGAIGMIDILAKVKHRTVMLEVIGPSSDKVRTAMIKHARKRGVESRLVLAGPEHNANLPCRLAGAAVFLFPSTHPEGLNKTVMEAMAVALPVVAYNMPGMDVLIKDGVSGWLVPSRDTAAAAAKVDMLLSDSEAATRMGLAGQSYIATAFDPLSVEAQWDTLFRNVLGHRYQ